MPAFARFFTLTAIAAALTAAVLPTAMKAQGGYDEQAQAILRLFESGRKDTAYALIDTLKKVARFSPAVLYTRAQMTSDDRALGLYKELIALEPQGRYADKAALELVQRYIDKHDSLASYTWLTVLKDHYPVSPLINQADKAFRDVKSWKSPADSGTPAKTIRKHGSAAKDTTKTTGKHTPRPKPPVSPPALTGYALQLTLYSTKEKAEARARQLVTEKKVRAVALPKPNGAVMQYAVVVGPYKTLKGALADKSRIKKLCGTDPLPVKIE